jgi:hypothetical protein
LHGIGIPILAACIWYSDASIYGHSQPCLILLTHRMRLDKSLARFPSWCHFIQQATSGISTFPCLWGAYKRSQRDYNADSWTEQEDRLWSQQIAKPWRLGNCHGP